MRLADLLDVGGPLRLAALTGGRLGVCRRGVGGGGGLGLRVCLGIRFDGGSRSGGFVGGGVLTRGPTFSPGLSVGRGRIGGGSLRAGVVHRGGAFPRFAAGVRPGCRLFGLAGGGWCGLRGRSLGVVLAGSALFAALLALLFFIR